MALDASALAAFLIAVSFAAGLNLYATLATLGVFARLHWFVLPAGLGALANSWIIAAALTLFALEFVADKIPVFDVVWNGLQTFIRLPVAALVAYNAGSHLTPALQIAVTIAAGLIAALAHSSKTATRVLITASPEPLSNIALSTGGDAAAIGLTWLATRHPLAAAVATATALAAIVLLGRFIFRALRRQADALFRRFRPPTAPALQKNT